MIRDIRHAVVAVERAVRQALHVAHEEVVDDHRVGRLPPAVVRSLAVGNGGLLARRRHELFERVEDPVVDRRVQVAAHDDGRLAARDLLHLPHDELHTLAARHHALVVEMRVEVVELLARGLLAQMHPRHRTVAGAVPAARHAVGSLAQPQVAVVEQIVAVAQVEDGHDLAALLAVVAAHAHAAVLRKVLLDVLHLEEVAFLDAEDRRRFAFEHPQRRFAAVFPAVGTVVCHAEADVVGDDLRFALRRRIRDGSRKGGGSESGRGQKSENRCFHRYLDWFRINICSESTGTSRAASVSCRT